MNTIERKLYGRMMDVIQTCQRELRWKPTAAIRMIHKHNPVEAAGRMVLTPGGTAGFTRCWKAGRLELSFEAVILEEEVRPLFDEAVLAKAQNRLEQARSSPPMRG
jgi:hypothetical protein